MDYARFSCLDPHAHGIDVIESERLFAEHMFFLPQALDRKRSVKRIGCDDRDSIELPPREEGFRGCEAFGNLVGLTKEFGAKRVGPTPRHDFAGLNTFEVLRMSVGHSARSY